MCASSMELNEKADEYMNTMEFITTFLKDLNFHEFQEIFLGKHPRTIGPANFNTRPTVLITTSLQNLLENMQATFFWT